MLSINASLSYVAWSTEDASDQSELNAFGVLAILPAGESHRGRDMVWANVQSFMTDPSVKVATISGRPGSDTIHYRVSGKDGDDTWTFDTGVSLIEHGDQTVRVELPEEVRLAEYKEA